MAGGQLVQRAREDEGYVPPVMRADAPPSGSYAIYTPAQRSVVGSQNFGPPLSAPDTASAAALAAAAAASSQPASTAVSSMQMDLLGELMRDAQGEADGSARAGVMSMETVAMENPISFTAEAGTPGSMNMFGDMSGTARVAASGVVSASAGGGGMQGASAAGSGQPPAGSSQDAMGFPQRSPFAPAGGDGGGSPDGGAGTTGSAADAYNVAFDQQLGPVGARDLGLSVNEYAVLEYDPNIQLVNGPPN